MFLGRKKATFWQLLVNLAGCSPPKRGFGGNSVDFASPSPPPRVRAEMILRWGGVPQRRLTFFFFFPFCLFLRLDFPV